MCSSDLLAATVNTKETTSVQTFLTSADYESVGLLDMKRLGKQRVEAWQIVQALTGASTGWTNHPATKMWRNHVGALCRYGEATCHAWRNRGYKDSLLDRFRAVGRQYDSQVPCWWNDPRIYATHRSALLRKKPDFYSVYGWSDDPTVPYFWPEPCDHAEHRIVIPDPVHIEYRFSFALAFYDNLLLATEADSAVKALGHTYRGGYYDGTLCGRERAFDRASADGTMLYAVSMRG